MAYFRKSLKMVVFVFCVVLFAFVLKENVMAAGQTKMFVGENETFNANINTYDTIKNYSWTISGTGAYITNQSAHSCQITATSPGTVYLNYTVTSTYTWYVYTDVQRTKKQYFTNTQVNRASWEITIGNPITVSFDPNGGVVGTTSKPVGYGGGYTYGVLPVATRDGYVFDGWYTSASGGTNVTADTVVSTNTSHTLYAQWIKKFAYTIHFDGNGNTGGSMEDMICNYGGSYNLTSNTFVKKGNRFIGWSTNPNSSSVQYANKAFIKNLRKSVGTVTLYAVWDDSNIAEGTCGDNLTWIIDPEGTLFISGSGKMSTSPSWKSYMEKINKVVIGEGITSISRGAFNVHNYTLKEVSIPNTVVSIADEAFWACRALKSVTIPDSVTHIGQWAFYNCDSLSQVNLGNSVKYIGEEAFLNCSFVSIHIPASVTTISAGALAVDELEKITVANDNQTYCSVQGVLFNKNKTILETIPSSYPETTYLVPDGVVEIGDKAFTKSSYIQTIVFPESVTTIGLSCFSENSVIKHLYFRGTPASLKKKVLVEGLSATSDAFTNVNATIHYPASLSSSWNSVKTEYSSAYSYYPAKLSWNAYSQATSMQGCNILRVDDEIYTYDTKEKTPPVEVYDQGMKLYEGKDYKVTYENNVGAGKNTAKVVVIGLGNYANTSNSISFTIEKAQQMPIYAVAGDTLLSQNKLMIENPSGYGALSYKSENPEIATVSNNGVITGVKIGETKITITVVGDANHESGSDSIVIKVVHNESLAPSSIRVSKTKVDYCVGSKINTDDITVTAYYSDGYSTQVKDYKVNTADIDMKKAGKKSLIISYTKNGKTVQAAVTINANAHIKGNVVKENVVAATTKKKGRYEEVTYCKVCGCEVTRKKYTTPRLLAVGESKKDTKTGGEYVVTKRSSKSKTVEYKKSIKKTTTNITIPATVELNGETFKVTSIAKKAFKNNTKVKKVVIGKNVTKIGDEAFYKCTALTKITVPDNVTTIGKQAFYGCKKLKTVKLGKKLTTISDKAFYKCTLMTSITIPSKVSKIGKQAFYGCKKLKTIAIKTKTLKTSNLGKDAFKGINSTATIEVPKSKYKSYKAMLKKAGVGSKVKYKKK